MDPQQVVIDFIEGKNRRAAARAYDEWLEKGGFRAKILIGGLPEAVLMLDPRRPGIRTVSGMHTVTGRCAIL
jgi:hypothetical protein